jgi:hypothetical protein
VHRSWGSGREVVLIRIKVDSQGYICYREFGLKEFELANPLVIDNEDNIFHPLPNPPP